MGTFRHFFETFDSRGVDGGKISVKSVEAPKRQPGATAVMDARFMTEIAEDIRFYAKSLYPKVRQFMTTQDPTLEPAIEAIKIMVGLSGGTGLAKTIEMILDQDDENGKIYVPPTWVNNVKAGAINLRTHAASIPDRDVAESIVALCKSLIAHCIGAIRGV
jgi:hypothetical protein